MISFSTPDEKSVMVRCTGNSCHSQLRHGYQQQALHDQANEHSAGMNARGSNMRPFRAVRDQLQVYPITPWDYPAKAALLYHQAAA